MSMYTCPKRLLFGCSSPSTICGMGIIMVMVIIVYIGKNSYIINLPTKVVIIIGYTKIFSLFIMILNKLVLVLDGVHSFTW